MKKTILMIVMLLIALTAIACQENTGLAGEYIGYAWQGEASGVTFEEASQYIETKMTLDKDGVIVAFEMDFIVKSGDTLKSRLDQTSEVTIDYTQIPTSAQVGETYVKGNSMFTATTQDFMSFYAYGVSEDGTFALAIVEPVTRFMFETRLDASFDYDQKISALNVENGLSVPTTRMSSFGLVRPTSWDNYLTKNVFNVHGYSHVITDSGIFEGITQNATVRDLLEALDITFSNGIPVEKEATYGFFGLGGWKGNYEAIAEYLIGKNAKDMTSLIDWTIERYALGINENNQFGVDVLAGGTRTVQDSFDTISGATVRVSRESTSFQRALVQAGIITEDEVIIGRF